MYCGAQQLRSMTPPRQFELFVRNKRDEYITTIELRREDRPGHEDEDATDLLPSKCVVVDYTRDRVVMESTAGCAGALTMVAVREQDKLKSFRSYLAGRKKAGVVKVPGGGRLCLLPVSGSGIAGGESIVALMQGGIDARDSGEDISQSRNQADSPRQAPPTPTLTTPAPFVRGSGGGSEGSAGGIGGFLGSIMGSISETHKSVADTAAVDRVAQAQEQAIKQRVERFKGEVIEKLEAFSTDPSSISHAFPHVEKSLRAIQHGLADDFDGITTRTEGDIDDKHVVAYKLGYEPPDDDVQLDPQVRVGPARNTSAGLANAAPIPAIVSKGVGKRGVPGPDAGDLVRIGTVVKDRRTVQEIEEDSRKRRRHGYAYLETAPGTTSTRR